MPITMHGHLPYFPDVIPIILFGTFRRIAQSRNVKKLIEKLEKSDHI